MTLEASTLDSGDGDGSVAHGKQSHDELTTHTEQLLPAFPFGVWTRLPSASVHHRVLSMAAAFSCYAHKCKGGCASTSSRNQPGRP